MKRLAVLFTLLILALPARAHFVWLIPNDARRDVLMVFSDAPAADESVPIEKIAQTKLFARGGAKGEMVKIKTAQEKHAYRVTLEGDGVTMIAGSCRYGVLKKGKDAPFLLMYHAKTILRSKGRARERAGWIFAPTPQLPLEIIPVENKAACQVYWQGKPAAGVEVVLTIPGMEKSVERKTDAKGQVDMPAAKVSGVYGIRARYVDNKQGELDGKKYQEIRHYATFTADIRLAEAAKER